MRRLVKYELRSMLGNFFAIFFGLVFPIVMLYILYPVIIKDVPEVMKAQVSVQLFVQMMLVIPLALLFIGFSALFSQEIEKGVINRLVLFGISEGKQMQAKMIANAIGTTLAIILYTVATASYINLSAPTLFAFFALVVTFAVLSVSLFVLAYGICLLARRFSIAYGITMTLYFAIMMLSGLMGLQIEDLPKVVQGALRYLPTAVLPGALTKAWQLNSYNFMPLVQAFIVFGAICGLVCFAGLRKNARRLN